MDFGVARLESSTLTVGGHRRGLRPLHGPRADDGREGGRPGRRLLAGRRGLRAAHRAARPSRARPSRRSWARSCTAPTCPPRQVDGRLPEELNARLRPRLRGRARERYARAMDFARDLYAAVGAGARPRDRRTERARHPADARRWHGTTPDASVRPASRPPPRTVRIARRRPPGRREGVLLAGQRSARAREVYLDGKPVGHDAAREPSRSRFGRHVVRMEAEGREPVSAEVELQARAAAAALSFTLPPARQPAHAPLRPRPVRDLRARGVAAAAAVAGHLPRLSRRRPASGGWRARRSSRSGSTRRAT